MNVRIGSYANRGKTDYVKSILAYIYISLSRCNHAVHGVLLMDVRTQCYACLL